jgi:hypothetical protein
VGGLRLRHEGGSDFRYLVKNQIIIKEDYIIWGILIIKEIKDFIFQVMIKLKDLLK